MPYGIADSVVKSVPLMLVIVHHLALMGESLIKFGLAGEPKVKIKQKSKTKS